jgi:hypothetical protein
MVLGSHFFVTPSDSVAVIAANAQAAIPYFKDGLKVGVLGQQGGFWGAGCWVGGGCDDGKGLGTLLAWPAQQ